MAIAPAARGVMLTSFSANDHLDGPDGNSGVSYSSTSTGSSSMLAGIIRQWIAAFLVICAVALPRSGNGADAVSTVSGTWIIKDLILRIFDCQDRVCGQIVWLRDQTRRPSQCGRIIVWGLKASGQNVWQDGSILDPDDNNIYRLSAVFEPDGTLRARIFRGIPLIGKTEVLKRVDLRPFTGQC